MGRNRCRFHNRNDASHTFNASFSAGHRAWFGCGGRKGLNADNRRAETPRSLYRLGGILIASLSVRQLSKRFGTNQVLRDISFDVAEGEFCILLGPSGCGKSTLLRLIAGLEQATEGEIVIGGERVDHLAPRQRDIAFVFQSYALYPHMTVFKNLAFSLKLRGASADEIEAKVRNAAQLLEIETLLERRPQELSGGQRQRVALGRAIVRHPKIFLFDEPLSNLDAALRATMRVELARLHRRLHATIVYVTHDQAEALTLGDKIIVLYEGTIQQIGPPTDIYRRPANIRVASFVGSPQINLLEGRVDENGAIFQCGQLRLNLSAVFKKPLPNLAGSVLTMGIRAEDLQPAVDEEESWLRGEVELVEDLGSDRFVHLKCDHLDLVARAGRDVVLRQGEPLGLKVAASQIHFFRGGERVDPF
ncbi:MAG: sn-glycerol-3-phosphate ABC transporter ATP-binding protein UgpC [Candidatus Binatia bacterium]